MSVQAIGNVIGLVIGWSITLMFMAVAVAHVLHKLGILPLKRSIGEPLRVADFQTRRLDFTPRTVPPRFHNLAVSIAPSHEEVEIDPTFDPNPTPPPARFYDAVVPIAMTSSEEVDKEPPGKVKLRYNLTRR